MAHLARGRLSLRRARGNKQNFSLSLARPPPSLTPRRRCYCQRRWSSSLAVPLQISTISTIRKANQRHSSNPLIGSGRLAARAIHRLFASGARVSANRAPAGTQAIQSAGAAPQTNKRSPSCRANSPTNSTRRALDMLANQRVELQTAKLVSGAKAD